MLPDGTSILIQEWRRREARDEILRESRKQVMKDSMMLERTRSALMREIRSGAKELRLMEKMKIMRQEKDSRIEEVLHQISGAISNDRCISEDRGTVRPRRRSVCPRMETKMGGDKGGDLPEQCECDGGVSR